MNSKNINVRLFSFHWLAIIVMLISLGMLFGCQTNPNPKGKIWESSEYTELSTKANPDDPDVFICDSLYYPYIDLEGNSIPGAFAHKKIQFIQEDDEMEKFTIKIIPNNSKSDTIILEHISLDEWIPTSPNYLDKRSYESKVALFNQQFNRIQAKFELKKREFRMGGRNLESKTIVRVDLAKNCLHLPLWEVIGFSKRKDGLEAPAYHGWFKFPYELHTYLLLHQGWTLDEAEMISKNLSVWKGAEPGSKKFNLDMLRTIKPIKTSLSVMARNDTLYPMHKNDERFKKFNNIIYPKGTSQIDAFLSDSTQFANFVDPGLYSKKSPMKTELGRFKFSNQIQINSIQPKNNSVQAHFELELDFNRNEDYAGESTRLVFGGIRLDQIDTMDVNTPGKAKFQQPFGIGNHSFNQSYKTLSDPKNKSIDNPYYGLMLDGEGNWLNNHLLGLDGVVLHFSTANPQELHIWLLSFERHAFVGHYIVEAQDWQEFMKGGK